MTTQETLPDETIIPAARRRASEPELASDEAGALELKARARHMLDAGKKRAIEWKDGVENGIREKPIQSILIAAAVGVVIGVLVGRRGR